MGSEICPEAIPCPHSRDPLWCLATATARPARCVSGDLSQNYGTFLGSGPAHIPKGTKVQAPQAHVADVFAASLCSEGLRCIRRIQRGSDVVNQILAVNHSCLTKVLSAGPSTGCPISACGEHVKAVTTEQRRGTTGFIHVPQPCPTLRSSIDCLLTRRRSQRLNTAKTSMKSTCLRRRPW